MRNVTFSALIALAACSSNPAPNTVSTASTSSTEAAVKTDAPSPAETAPKKMDVAADKPAGTGSANTQHAGTGGPPVISLIEIARPPFAYTLKTAVKVSAGAAPKITKASEKKNAITDTVEWFQKNGLQLAGRQPSAGEPSLPKAPDTVPAELGSNKLHHILDHGDHTVLMYGPTFASMQVLIVLDKDGKPKAQYDFSTFVKPTEVVAGEERFTDAEIYWAIEKDGVLYVSTAHATFAKSTKGKNAFVTAIHAKSGELMWQSEPLVCNSQNFVVHGGHIICGYGFSKEDDFLYVLSRADGKTVSKLPMSSGATYLVMKDGKLHARGYDKDFVFDVK